LVVLSAFLAGIITGSYLYLVGFAPEFEANKGQTAEEVGELMIVGDMYGGMRAGLPPSFQVNGDREFRYIPFSDNPEVPAPAVEGRVPRELMEDVTSLLSESTLDAASEEITPEVCAQMVDGIDYKYTILVDSVEYQLNTCGTNFTADSELGAALEQLWEYFDTVAATPAA
jgi:hypothetical protein